MYKHNEYKYTVKVIGEYHGVVYYNINGDDVDMDKNVFDRVFSKIS